MLAQGEAIFLPVRAGTRLLEKLGFLATQYLSAYFVYLWISMKKRSEGQRREPPLTEPRVGHSEYIIRFNSLMYFKDANRGRRRGPGSKALPLAVSDACHTCSVHSQPPSFQRTAVHEEGTLDFKLT